MTRIIGGSLGGRRIRTPTGDRTRPTSDRVREALFSALEARVGSLAGLAVLDLYAGSGAVGLEALSRGAGRAVFVESDRRTAALIAANARSLGVRADVRAASVHTALREAPAAGERFDVVFSDPPYPLGEDDLAVDLELLAPWLAPDALVVVERSRRSPAPRWPAGRIGPEADRRYGETVLHYGRAPAEQDPAHRNEQDHEETR